METQRQYSSMGSHNRGHNINNQSQWLHKTLSDLDMKMKTLMNLIQETGDNRGESYDTRKPELIEMLQELGRSYQNLAQKHDQLRSKSANILAPSISSTCNLKRVSNTNTINTQNVEPKHEVVDSHPESDSANLDHEHLHKTSNHELKSSEQNKNISKNTSKTLIFRTDNFERDNTWSELKFQVTKLLEENLQQQAELLRRNAEKREAIKELQSRLEYVKAENRALQNHLRCQKVDAKRNQNQMSRLKRQFSFRFLGCSS